LKYLSTTQAEINFLMKPGENYIMAMFARTKLKKISSGLCTSKCCRPRYTVQWDGHENCSILGCNTVWYVRNIMGWRTVAHTFPEQKNEGRSFFIVTAGSNLKSGIRLPIISQLCETWPPTLLEDHKWTVFFETG
jgi:hypothetical protein